MNKDKLLDFIHELMHLEQLNASCNEFKFTHNDSRFNHCDLESEISDFESEINQACYKFKRALDLKRLDMWEKIHVYHEELWNGENH